MSDPSANVRGVPYGCPLSPREFEVVQGLADGKTYQAIGLSLGINESTVRSLAHRGFMRIDVTDRAQAVIKCWQYGWIKIGGVAPVNMGDEPPDPEVTPEMRVYLVAFMRWLKDPSDINHIMRRHALTEMWESREGGCQQE